MSPNQQPSKRDSGGITRRSFTAAAVAAATAVLIQPAQATQMQESLVQNDKLAPSAPQADAAMSKLSPGAQAEVEMKVNSIFRKFGNRLNDEQKADIRKVMAETQSGLEKMRTFSLENGDLPATIFRAGQSSEKK